MIPSSDSGSVDQPLTQQGDTAGTTHSPCRATAERAAATISDLIVRKGRVPLPYGFKDLDCLTWGMRRAEVTLVGGPTSIGKTSFVTSIIERQLFPSPSGAVAFFTTDDSAQQVLTRCIASRARVNLKLLRDGLISKKGEEQQRLTKAFEEFHECPLTIEDRAHQTIETVAARATTLHATSPLGLIVVDCVQMLDPTDATRPHTRDQQLSEIARGLKNMAKGLDVPVIGVSQLTRTPGRSGQERPPHLADLRDSGSLEGAADTVILLSASGAFSGGSDYVNCVIAKQRNGPTGEVRLTLFREICRFENYSL